MLWSNLIYLHLYSACPVLLHTINTLDYKPHFNHTVKQHFTLYSSSTLFTSYQWLWTAGRSGSTQRTLQWIKLPPGFKLWPFLFLDNTANYLLLCCHMQWAVQKNLIKSNHFFCHITCAGTLVQRIRVKFLCAGFTSNRGVQYIRKGIWELYECIYVYQICVPWQKYQVCHFRVSG